MEMRKFWLGTQNICGMDYFVVLDCKPKISFREMLDGVKAIEVRPNKGKKKHGNSNKRVAVEKRRKN